MAQVLPTFPELPRHSYRVALEGSTYGVTLAWRERTAGWYISLETADGSPIVTNRRLVGESQLLRYVSAPQGPPGILLVRGPDHYIREALGEILLVVYYTSDEITEPDLAASRGLRVV